MADFVDLLLLFFELGFDKNLRDGKLHEESRFLNDLFVGLLHLQIELLKQPPLQLFLLLKILLGCEQFARHVALFAHLLSQLGL